MNDENRNGKREWRQQGKSNYGRRLLQVVNKEGFKLIIIIISINMFAFIGT